MGVIDATLVDQHRVSCQLTPPTVGMTILTPVTPTAETDSVVDLWQQVITHKPTPSVAPIQNQCLSSKTPIHFNTVKSNNILDEEKISSV